MLCTNNTFIFCYTYKKTVKFEIIPKLVIIYAFEENGIVNRSKVYYDACVVSMMNMNEGRL